MTVEVVRDNRDVVMAPSMVFDEGWHEGMRTVVTDASRAKADNWSGGYTFASSAEGMVFAVSSPWPPEAKRAMDGAATRCPL